MPKKIFSFVYALNFISQAAMTMLMPAALLIGGGWLLTNRCGVGKWVMVLSIVSGVAAGVFSLFRFIISSAACIDPTEQKGAQKDERS